MPDEQAVLKCFTGFSEPLTLQPAHAWDGLSVSTWMRWMWVDIVWKLQWNVNNVRDFFAATDNSFHILQESFMNLLCYIHNKITNDMTFKFNRHFFITFLHLDSQQNKTINQGPVCCDCQCVWCKYLTMAADLLPQGLWGWEEKLSDLCYAVFHPTGARHVEQSC